MYNIKIQWCTSSFKIRFYSCNEFKKRCKIETAAILCDDEDEESEIKSKRTYKPQMKVVNYTSGLEQDTALYKVKHCIELVFFYLELEFFELKVLMFRRCFYLKTRRPKWTTNSAEK